MTTIARKYVPYIGFAVGSVLVVFAFVTSKNYVQLIGASLLYIPLAYYAFHLFPNNWFANIRIPTITIARRRRQVKTRPVRVTAPAAGGSEIGVVDINKRAFLKLVGATSISFFLFSLLGRRVDSLLFPGSQGGGSTISAGAGDSLAQSPVGYRIAEIDDTGIVAYYGFVDTSGAWFIMKEDSSTGSFRYAKGESQFPRSWTKREGLDYDYYHNLF